MPYRHFSIWQYKRIPPYLASHCKHEAQATFFLPALCPQASKILQKLAPRLLRLVPAKNFLPNSGFQSHPLPLFSVLDSKHISLLGKWHCLPTEMVALPRCWEILTYESFMPLRVMLSMPRMQGPDHLCHLLLHNRLLQNRGLKQQTFIFW